MAPPFQLNTGPRKPPRAKPAPKPALSQRAIAAAQNVSVKSLDPALPDQPFAQWFQSTVGKDRKVAWESNDCGEQTGDPATTPADPPVCGQATARLPDGRSVIVMISVGTAKQGITGAAGVVSIIVEKENAFDTVPALSELPAAIAAAPPQTPLS